MPYTEFRKSYGDIKVVIPTVDFSSLTKDEAKATARSLRAYKDGFVCHHLNAASSEGTQKAQQLIRSMLLANGGNQCGEPHLGVLIRKANSLDDSYFNINNKDGVIVRKAWCKHMATEIKREFAL